MTTFADKIKAQEEEGRREGISSQGGGWYKFVEGDNVFRVLTEPELFFEDFKRGICYTDCGYQGSAKFLTFVLDMKDNKVKVARLPYGIGTTIAGFQQDEDYKFDGFPMPFNIKVKAKNAGTKEVEYTVLPSPNRSDVSEQVLGELSKSKSVAEILTKMKDDQKQKHIEDGTWQKEQDRKASLKEEIATARATGNGEMDNYPNEVNVDDIPF